MKKYLFGLGAMLVGVGLLFVFNQTEVNARQKFEPVFCTEYHSELRGYEYCNFKDLNCVSSKQGISCVKN